MNSVQTIRPRIDLGATARDSITGFSGVVVCISYWLNGCQRVTLQPKECREGKPLDYQTFDVQQIELVDAPSETQPGHIPPVMRSLAGGPQDDPGRSGDPR